MWGAIVLAEVICKDEQMHGLGNFLVVQRYLFLACKKRLCERRRSWWLSLCLQKKLRIELDQNIFLPYRALWHNYMCHHSTVPPPQQFFLQTLWFRLFYWNVGVTSINEGCKNAHCLVGILLCYKAYIWGIPSVSTELLIWWWCLYREEWSARLWSRVFTVSRHQWRVCNTHAH